MDQRRSSRARKRRIFLSPDSSNHSKKKLYDVARSNIELFPNFHRKGVGHTHTGRYSQQGTTPSGRLFSALPGADPQLVQDFRTEFNKWQKAVGDAAFGTGALPSWWRADDRIKVPSFINCPTGMLTDDFAVQMHYDGEPYLSITLERLG